MYKTKVSSHFTSRKTGQCNHELNGNKVIYITIAFQPHSTLRHMLVNVYDSTPSHHVSNSVYMSDRQEALVLKKSKRLLPAITALYTTGLRRFATSWNLQDTALPQLPQYSPCCARCWHCVCTMLCQRCMLSTWHNLITCQNVPGSPSAFHIVWEVKPGNEANYMYIICAAPYKLLHFQMSCAKMYQALLPLFISFGRWSLGTRLIICI